MENRFLLAVVLSLAILMVYQTYVEKQQQEWRALHGEQEIEKQQETSAIETPAATTIGRPSPQQPLTEIEQKADKVILPPSDGPCKEIVVDTPLYQAIFCSHSGRPMSWRLKKYQQSKTCNCPIEKMWKSDSGGESCSDVSDSESWVERIYAQGGEELPLGLEIMISKDRREPLQEILEPNLSSLTLEDGQNPTQLVFSGKDIQGRSIKRIYTFSADEYLVSLDIEILGIEPRIETAGLGLKLIERIQEKGNDRYTFAGFMGFINNKLEKEKELKNGLAQYYSGQVEWEGFSDKYFFNGVIPVDNPISSIRLEQLKAKVEGGSPFFNSHLIYNIQSHMTGRDAHFSYALYLGPKDLKELQAAKHLLEQSIDLGWFSFVAKPLLLALTFFYGYTHNYGIAIILITVFIKILFIPLTHKQYESMEAMKKLQPKMQELREKFKDDKERMNREMMDFYRNNNVNPLSGCWPMLLQIPVFFAFYRALMSSIELRHAPFIFWIQDLSAKDPCYITPLIMGATMFLQQKMTPMAGGDPMQQKMMQYLPVIFTVLFLNFPSGLVLYWLVNNVLTIGQQYVSQRRK